MLESSTELNPELHPNSNPEPDHELENTPLKPVLKWAGGKRWLVERLKKIWVQIAHECVLVEPFCGGLSIALGLNPSQAKLNDVNPHLINLYRWLQQGLTIDDELMNEREFYYQRREEFNQLVTSQQTNSRRAAILFYYLNRTGFNGLCRFNQQGKFNVPFGQYKTINYCRDFSAYQKTLNQWSFLNEDFERISPPKNSFIYADPPYDVEFHQYSQGGFAWEDQKRLAGWLGQQEGAVIVSNQATPRILKLYEDLGFQVDVVSAPRRISCNGDRTPAQEMLAFKDIKLSP